MPIVRYKLICGMFKLIGLNKMLDKQGTELERLMHSYVKKQDDIKVPAEKISKNYDFEKKVIEGFDCYVTRNKAGASKQALLYLFGGGYILPCDPGDFALAGQFVDNTGRNGCLWDGGFDTCTVDALVKRKLNKAARGLRKSTGIFLAASRLKRV